MNRIDFFISNFESFLRTILHPIWVWIKRHYLFILFMILLVTFLYFFICNVFINNRAWADWTGFGPYTGSLPKDDRPKTLWDFLGIILGVFAAIIIAILNEWNQSRRKQTEFEINADQQREDILRTYLDDIGKLLMDNNIKRENCYENSSIIDVAQVKTINALRSLDVRRRESIFQFLRDTGLANFILKSASMDYLDLQLNDLHYFNLSHADLSYTKFTFTSLRSINLSRANLSKSIFINSYAHQADLSNSFLLEADLSNAIFNAANLSGAILAAANLKNADFHEANLSDAFLLRANLSGTVFNNANLSNALVTPEQLSQAKTLKGAIMPDGTIHE